MFYQKPDYRSFFKSKDSLSSIFSSTIDFFNVFSYKKVITLIQSRSFVYIIFHIEIYSFVITIAILVNKAALDDITIPALGFNIANVVDLTVEADPARISVIPKNTFFLFKLLYFFL